MDEDTRKALTNELQDLFAEFAYRTDALYRSHGLRLTPGIAMVLTSPSEETRGELHTFRLQNVPSMVADLLLVQGLNRGRGPGVTSEVTGSVASYSQDDKGELVREMDPEKVKKDIHEKFGEDGMTDDCTCDVCKYVRASRGS